MDPVEPATKLHTLQALRCPTEFLKPQPARPQAPAQAQRRAAGKLLDAMAKRTKKATGLGGRGLPHIAVMAQTSSAALFLVSRRFRKPPRAKQECPILLPMPTTLFLGVRRIALPDPDKLSDLDRNSRCFTVLDTSSLTSS